MHSKINRMQEGYETFAKVQEALKTREALSRPVWGRKKTISADLGYWTLKTNTTFLPLKKGQNLFVYLTQSEEDHGFHPWVN